MPFSSDDRRWLDAAARQASPFLGTTAENPTVGAIIVDPKTQKLLGRAVTAPGGRPHAETQAIEEAGEAARAATLYVTLEPCNHFGRTPPCVDAVLAAGIARVVIGVVDPDPRTAGGGLERLAQAGVEIVVADHLESQRLHEGHVSRKTRNRPFVSAKLAVSADEKVGLPDRGNFAVTGEAARRWTHMQRAQSNAVMVGWGTARLDQPQLTVRLAGLEDRKPLRVIVAGLGTVEEGGSVVSDPSAAPVLVFATPEKKLTLPEGIELARVKGFRGRPDMGLVLGALAERGIQSLLVEAGPTLLETLLAAGLIDRFHLLRSEVVIGPEGVPATAKGSIEHRIAASGFSLVDHRVLGADNLRTFERTF
ncbi:MAG TPA: bifunctional diaminohydroxyphosphoribosylaminopyrimidine deaminase/5-amino-6-(5-phosphoribosylamino)uracil reductase RibD [Devosiaceae bacterium]|nr:bifunctional diaminohydroxyphosphoribosylaminopyrimidine deaminase/5-amino-6-(5-phosphoribosylamino)uracil reductase RibD [Devosiaceae bacterium]